MGKVRSTVVVMGVVILLGAITLPLAAQTAAPATNNSTQQYWFAVGDQQFGPYPVSYLQEAVASGQLKPDSWVWAPGMESWARASTVRALDGVFSGAPLQGRSTAPTAPAQPAAAPQAASSDAASPAKTASSARPAEDLPSVVDTGGSLDEDDEDVAKSGIFAPFGISLGVGADFDFGWGGFNGKYAGASINSVVSDFGPGAFVFGDFTFVEAAFGVQAFNWTAKGLPSGDGSYNMVQLNVSILGKLPFPIGKFTIFPLLGFENSYCFDFSGEAIPKKHDRLWLRLGAGFDVTLNDFMFVRGTVLWGFRQASAGELEFYEPYYNNDFQAKVHHGFSIRAALGFKLPI